MNIINAIEDPNLFRSFLADSKDSLDSWSRWITALRMVYGLAIPKADRPLIKECSGREKVRKAGFRTSLFLTGRRSGKSRMAAVIAAYESVLAGHQSKLSKGERGVVLICSPTRSQSRIVKDYCRSIFETPILAKEVTAETTSGFELRDGTRIEILAGDWRSVRGFTLLAAVVDEVAFFGTDSDSKVKSDTELIRALTPALSTVKGRLIAISSPYAERGWSFKSYQRHFGNDATGVLVWNSPSRTMNPTLDQRIIDEAMEEDLAAARAEFMGEFRSDIATYLPREIIEACIIKNRQQLSPQPGITYAAFVDISGGRNDDAAMSIAHRDPQTQKIVVDLAKRWRPPFSPDTIIGLMCEELAPFGITRVTGDRYAGEFTKQSFEVRNVRYNLHQRNILGHGVNPIIVKSKSQLYMDMLPRLCSREIELLDDPLLINQLAGLERRTRSGGRDSVDHGPNGHDDLANAVAGAVDAAAKSPRRVGPIADRSADPRETSALRARMMWSMGLEPESRAHLTILGR